MQINAVHFISQLRPIAYSGAFIVSQMLTSCSNALPNLKNPRALNCRNNTSAIIPTTVTEFKDHSAIERNNYNLGFTQIHTTCLIEAKSNKEFKREEQKIIDDIAEKADNNDDEYIQSEELKQYRNNLGSNNATFQETALDKVTEYMIRNGEHKLPSFVDYQKDTSVKVPSEIQELSPNDIFAFGKTQSNNTELKLPKDLPQESLEQYAIVKAMGLKISHKALNNTQDAIFCIEMAWRRALTLKAAKENPKLPIIAVYDKFGGGNTHGTIVSSLIQGGGALALNYGVEEFSSAKEIENSPSKSHFSPLPTVAQEITSLNQTYNIFGFNLSATQGVYIAHLKEDPDYYLKKYNVNVNKIKYDGSNLSEYQSLLELLSNDPKFSKEQPGAFYTKFAQEAFNFLENNTIQDFVAAGNEGNSQFNLLGFNPRIDVVGASDEENPNVLSTITGSIGFLTKRKPGIVTEITRYTQGNNYEEKRLVGNSESVKLRAEFGFAKFRKEDLDNIKLAPIAKLSNKIQDSIKTLQSLYSGITQNGTMTSEQVATEKVEIEKISDILFSREYIFGRKDFQELFNNLLITLKEVKTKNIQYSNRDKESDLEFGLTKKAVVSKLTDFQRTTDPYIYFASDSLGFDETVEKVELNSNGKFTFHIQKKSQATSWATPQAILEAAFKKK